MHHMAPARRAPSTPARRGTRSEHNVAVRASAAQLPVRSAERSQHLAPSVKRLAQVAVATLLVAGCPVAIVWWLRASGAISSAALAMILGMVLSLGVSYVGRVVWETRPGSEDLLFSELMIWGYLRRWRTERRLASALNMVGPMNEAQRRSADGLSTSAQAKLLEGLVAGVETRDPYLHGHSRRVARHSWMIARRMGLPRAQVARIRTAAAIHDVGKIETPKAILHKAGPLNDEEYEVIKRHPGDGADMSTVLRDADLTAMVRHHHERLDGTGYPNGLSGEAIPLGARIIAVADTFDAITSMRPYRSASPHKNAIDILKKEAGTKLDPDVVRAFCRHYAGRGPLALWSSVAGLPGRLASWLASSAASVASVAKIVAVAALVGGAAVTTSALAPAVARHHATSASSARTAGLIAQPIQSRSVTVVALSSPAAVARNGHPSRGHHALAIKPTVRSGSATGVAPSSAAGGAVVTQSSQSGSPVAGSGHGTPTGKQQPAGSTGAPAKTEPRGKGKEPAAKTEPAGKSKEPQGKGKEPATKTEPPGKSKEPAGKATEPPGKSTEPPGKKSTEPPVKTEPPGKSKEPPGKSTEPSATTEPPGKVKVKG
jgi:HD domain-containing protein